MQGTSSLVSPTAKLQPCWTSENTGISWTVNCRVSVPSTSTCSLFLKGQKIRPLACIPGLSQCLLPSCGATGEALASMSTHGRWHQPLVPFEKTVACTLDSSWQSQTSWNDMGSSSEQIKCRSREIGEDSFSWPVASAAPALLAAESLIRKGILMKSVIRGAMGLTVATNPASEFTRRR